MTGTSQRTGGPTTPAGNPDSYVLRLALANYDRLIATPYLRELTEYEVVLLTETALYLAAAENPAGRTVPCAMR